MREASSFGGDEPVPWGQTCSRTNHPGRTTWGMASCRPAAPCCPAPGGTHGECFSRPLPAAVARLGISASPIWAAGPLAPTRRRAARHLSWAHWVPLGCAARCSEPAKVRWWPCWRLSLATLQRLGRGGTGRALLRASGELRCSTGRIWGGVGRWGRWECVFFLPSSAGWACCFRLKFLSCRMNFGGEASLIGPFYNNASEPGEKPQDNKTSHFLRQLAPYGVCTCVAVTESSSTRNAKICSHAASRISLLILRTW